MIAWPGTDIPSRALLAWMREFPDAFGRDRIAWAATRHMDAIRVVGENGAKFELDPTDHISREIARHGSYEAATIRRATAIMREKAGTLLDIGAAWGLYTCSLGVLPGVDVIAVEPTARSFVRLARNAALNGVAAKLFNVAMGPEPQLVPMGNEVAGSDLTARIRPGGDRFVSAVEPIRVLDAAGCERPRLLKIDVEGSDMPILAAYPWDTRAPDWLIVELFPPYLSEYGITIADVVTFLRSHGYEHRETLDDLNGFFERVR